MIFLKRPFRSVFILTPLIQMFQFANVSVSSALSRKTNYFRLNTNADRLRIRSYVLIWHSNNQQTLCDEKQQLKARMSIYSQMRSPLQKYCESKR